MSLIQIDIHQHIDTRAIMAMLRKVQHTLTQDFIDLKASNDRIVAALADVAQDVRDLLDKVHAGMTEEEVADLKATFSGTADAAEAAANIDPEPEV